MANIQKRTWADGRCSYRARVRIKGYPSETASFDRLTDAKRWASQRETDLRRSRRFPGEVDERRRVGEVIERYIDEILPLKPKVAYLQKAQLLWWHEQIGDILVTDLKAPMLARCRDRLLAGKTVRGTRRAAGTVNRYLSILSHVFSTAVKEWEWMLDNPMARVRKAKEPRGRVRFLHDDERDRLLEACHAHRNPFLYPVVILALTTGMRHGEIMGIRWRDVDLERTRVILHETKNGERRSVPLVGAALEAVVGLKGEGKARSALIFPSKKNPKKPMDIRKAWESCLRQAEIEDFRFHDLRHSAASYLAMSGASLTEIADVLGHKTLDMVKRYAHLTEGHKASVVERMAAKFLSDAPSG